MNVQILDVYMKYALAKHNYKNILVSKQCGSMIFKIFVEPNNLNGRFARGVDCSLCKG